MFHDHAFRFNSAEATTEHGYWNPDGKFDNVNREWMQRIGRKLKEAYPGHPWGVSAEVEHGIVKISIMGFIQWPYIIKVDTLKSDPGLRSVVEAGGHLLERFKMPRAGFSMADWMTANERTPWFFNRNKKAPE